MTLNLLNDFNNCPDMATAWLYAGMWMLCGFMLALLLRVIIKVREG